MDLAQLAADPGLEEQLAWWLVACQRGYDCTESADWHRTSVTFEAVAPIVAVNSPKQALDYYQRVLGFKIAWQWRSQRQRAPVW